MTPNIFIITQGTDSLLSNILSKFLDEIDDINLVNISFIKKIPTMYMVDTKETMS